MNMKKTIPVIFLLFAAASLQAQTSLEDHFNLCLEFGAPSEVVQLFQPFRTYKAETNGTVSFVTREDQSLLNDTPYTEYQIWYTIDQVQGLYQSSLIVRSERLTLQNIFTSYLRKFSSLYGEPVYTNLSNGSLLVFWFDEEEFTVKARLVLDIVNSYRYISITYCSPLPRHSRLLSSLYNGASDDDTGTRPLSQTAVEDSISGTLPGPDSVIPSE